MSARDYQYRDENRKDKAALRKLARKRANDFYYGPNGIMRENEPDPKTYSPTIRRIEEAYAKHKTSESGKGGPQISQPGDKHEQEADLVAKKVTEDAVNVSVGDITSSSTPVQPKHEEGPFDSAQGKELMAKGMEQSSCNPSSTAPKAAGSRWMIPRNRKWNRRWEQISAM
jgi:hypothetical protein